MGMIDQLLAELADLRKRLAHLESLDYSLDAQDSDTVDGFHANATATASNILPLDAGGDLQLGAGDVVTSGNMDGVDVSDHSARHDASGADPLVTVPIHDHSGDAGDGGTFLPTRHGCRLTKSADQSINNCSETPVTFDGESYDVGGLHDNITNNSRITVVTAGKYLLTGIVAYEAGLDTVAAILRLNGTTQLAIVACSSPLGGEYGRVCVTDIMSLAAGNYVELLAYMNSGGAAANVIGAETTFAAMLLAA